MFDLELVEAQRRVAMLEAERASANQAVNDLLIRSWQLERSLAETADALAGAEHNFEDFVRATIEYVRADNAALHGRLHALESSRLWKLEMRARRIGARIVSRFKRR